MPPLGSNTLSPRVVDAPVDRALAESSGFMKLSCSWLWVFLFLSQRPRTTHSQYPAQEAVGST